MKKEFEVRYNGNASRFRNFSHTVWAETERKAVEQVYMIYLDDQHFPQEDGSIFDCSGNQVATADDNTIEYDGGSFYAEEVNAE